MLNTTPLCNCSAYSSLLRSVIKVANQQQWHNPVVCISSMYPGWLGRGSMYDVGVVLSLYVSSVKLALKY